MDECLDLFPHLLFNPLKNYLISTGEYETFKRLRFSTSESFKKYFELIWKRDDIVRAITSKITCNFPGKNNEIFTRLLVEGVKLFYAKQYSEALLKYNNAILFAPHTRDAIGNSPIAKVYYCRCILLYSMGRFAEAINDIDRAFQHGCFIEKEKGMLHIKIKCLIKLNRCNDAENLINQLIERAIQANDSNWLRILQRFQNICYETKIRNIAQGVTPVSLDHETETPSFFTNCVQDDTNILNEKMKVSYSNIGTTGRHFIATKDIEPGEPLMTEKAICSIPRPKKENLSLFCCVCLRRNKIALPCEKCSLVSFCSKACISSSTNNHKMECAIFSIFLDVDYELALVFRTLLKFPMEEIISEFKNKKILNNNYTPGLEHAKAFVESPITYSSLTKMIGNWDKRNGDYCLQMAANAVLGVKLLQRVPKFWERKDKTSPPIEQNFETLTILGGEIIKLQLNFQCNTYYIRELQIDKQKDIASSDSCYAGYGIYKSFSLLNHSCSPNAFFSSFKDMLYLYSVNFIPKGQEILVDYGVNYIYFDKLYREIYLYSSYCMECKCEACSKNWPVYVDLPNDYDLKCPSCSQAVKKDLKFCPLCFPNTRINDMQSLIQNLNYLNKISNRINEASEKYVNSVKEVDQYNVSTDNLNVIMNYILELSKHTTLPHKTIALAETTLKRCLDLVGNAHYVDTD